MLFQGQTALDNRADREQRPVEDIHAELLAAGLDHLEAADNLTRRWEMLSKRQRDVTALACLGYTNRQMAERMGVSQFTIKGYVRNTLVKWHMPSKNELRLMLERWDFSAWGEHPRKGEWGTKAQD